MSNARLCFNFKGNGPVSTVGKLAIGIEVSIDTCCLIASICIQKCNITGLIFAVYIQHCTNPVICEIRNNNRINDCEIVH